MVRRVLAFGHSHLGALQMAYKQLARHSESAKVWKFSQLWGRYDPFVFNTESQIQYNADLETDMLRLDEQAGEDAVYLSCLIGSEHFLWSVQGQSRPFDIILPFDDALPSVPGAELLPYSLTHRFVFDTISKILRFNGRLRALTGRPIYQLLPPPPVADQERVLAYAPSPIREGMLAEGVPHPAIRYKLWRLWVHVAGGIAEQDGVSLCDVPPETIDVGGMLLEAFSGDAVHGNERYGLAALRHVEAFIG